MLRANPFAGETVGPFDLLNHFPEYQNLHIDLPLIHRQHTDVLDYKLPAWHFAKQQLREGKLPLWSPYVMGGKPSMQLPVHSIITPAFLLYALFEQDAPGIYAASLVNLIIISIGSYLFLYALYPCSWAAWMGAVVFSYCGFNAGWFYWHHVNTSIWIPWLLFFTLRFLDTQERRFLPWITVASTLMILGGFPMVALYCYIMVALLLLFRTPLVENYTFITWLMPWAFIALSVGICAFAIQPLAEQLLQADLSERIGGSKLHFADLLWFLQPDYPKLSIENALYVGLIPILAIPVALSLAWRKQYEWKICWGLSLIVISTVFVFNLIPNGWIRMIPVIGSNPWNRMLIMTSLGLAIITTATLFQLAQSPGLIPRKWYLPCLYALSLFQIADQRHFFRHFVGPVPAGSVYPETKSIAAMKQGILPLQSILASNQFSGVLSYYGLAEWFAHGIRASEDKAILDILAPDAFMSPTAAQLKCNNIQFNESAMVYLNIAYIQCLNTTEKKLSTKEIPNAVANEIASDDIGTHSVIQHFYQPFNFTANQLEIKIATHKQQHLSSNLNIAILKDFSLIGTATCPASKLIDNQFVSCAINTTITMKPGNYALMPYFHPQTPAEKISVWMTPSPLYNVYVKSDGARHDLLFNMNFNDISEFSRILAVHMPDGKPQYELTDYEPGITVIKNLAVAGNAYFVNQLNDSPAPDFKPVKLMAYNNTRLDLVYSGKQSGWVVLPMRNYPGWEAIVDGEPVLKDTFLNILPAIRVSGPTRISYQYRPQAFYIACGISLIALLTTFFLFWRFRR